jgi:hypothetical protein
MSQLLESARFGDLPSVKRLLAEGASINETDGSGRSALLWAAYYCRLGTVEWLLTEGNARIDETNTRGQTVWNMQSLYLDHAAEGSRRGETVWDMLLSARLYRADADELTSLLKVMTLLAAVPPAFVKRLSPMHKALVEEGRLIRARLPAYFEQRRMYLRTFCTLPKVLQPLVAAYAEPTRDDIWDSRLL